MVPCPRAQYNVEPFTVAPFTVAPLTMTPFIVPPFRVAPFTVAPFTATQFIWLQRAQTDSYTFQGNQKQYTARTDFLRNLMRLP